MNIKLVKEDIESALIRQLERISGEDVKKCYQCGNCSAGCPVAYAMDVPPAQMIRFLQLGRGGEAFGAGSMWLCVGCLQCYSRCPKNVSAASLFEALRQMRLRSGGGHEEVREIPLPFLKGAPQQALVCGFRKLVG
ncbi:MAG: 4Fe-4S dicluster domain-containing protein [Deltaproteobacteria bacterium]|nr:4Fe-4S dicluster domain-containing protein [Deltaproteobacteria bacterium]